jgi:hypothetical protein
MERARREPERRRHRRVPVDARAEIVVSEGQWMGHYAVENLSAGGGYLVGSGGIDVGERLKVHLQLPAGAAVAVLAEVVRVDARGPDEVGLALAFREIPADAEDLIQAAVLAALEGHLAQAH